jgi:hypothetical protein
MGGKPTSSWACRLKDAEDSRSPCVAFQVPEIPPCDEVVRKGPPVKPHPDLLRCLGVRFSPPGGEFEPTAPWRWAVHRGRVQAADIERRRRSRPSDPPAATAIRPSTTLDGSGIDVVVRRAEAKIASPLGRL